MLGSKVTYNSNIDKNWEKLIVLQLSRNTLMKHTYLQLLFCTLDIVDMKGKDLSALDEF